MEEKLDIHNTSDTIQTATKHLYSNQYISDRQKKQFERFFDLCEIGKLGKHKTGNHRLLSYIYHLDKLLNIFRTDLDKVSESDLEKFYRDLTNNRIKRLNGANFKDNSKNDFLKALKKYLRFAYADDVKYKKMVGWIKDFSDKTEIPALSLEEVQKLISKSEYIRDRALIMFLFDSGCRIEEALNLKFKNLIVKEGETGEHYVVDIKFSKTLPRKISIPIAQSILTEWIKSHPERDNPEAYIFPVGYDACRMMLTRLSKLALGFKITLHQLRHSSASYYCKKINNPFKFVYRYGWTINSDQARRYVDRSQLEEDAQEEIVNHIRKDKFEEQQKEIEELKKQIYSLAEEVQKRNEKLKNNEVFITLEDSQYNKLEKLRGKKSYHDLIIEKMGEKLK